MKTFVVFLAVLMFFNINLFAQVQPTNEEIVNTALSYLGYQGYTCKEFLWHVMQDVGYPIGTGYRDCYLEIGIEVSADNAVRGDIIQVSCTEYPDYDISGIHTSIVLNNNGDGTFQCVHSNFHLNKTVTIDQWDNPFDFAENVSDPGHTFEVHFYRLGTVGTSSLVGHFQDGWHSDGTSQVIEDKYNAMAAAGHPLGNPWDNGGSIYVHEVNGMYIQDFQDSRDQGGPSNGYYHPYTAIIYDHDDPWISRVPRLLKEGFWDVWMNKTENGTPGWEVLGVPVTDEYSQNGYIYQRFYKFGDNYLNNPSDYLTFYLRWDPVGQTLIVENSNHQELSWVSLTASLTSSPSISYKSTDNFPVLTESNQRNGPVVEENIGGGEKQVLSDIKLNINSTTASSSSFDGLYHSGVLVANFDQPVNMLDGYSYDNFYAIVNGSVMPIDPFTMNGDMTIYVDDGSSEGNIQFSHWTIYPNPGTVNQPIHVEGQINNNGSGSATLSEVRIEFIDPNGNEVYHWSEYNVILDPGYYWYQWISCSPYMPGNHTARFKGLINGQWQTYATQTVYVQDDFSNPVSADFSASPTFGISPLVVQFIDQSLGGPTSYEWDFGDGTFSSDPNPLKVYNDSGFYTVSLTVSDEQSSDTLVKVNYISLYDSIDSCIIGLCGLPGRAFGIDVVGNYAYIANYDSGLQIIDISNPTSPVVVGSVDTPGLAWSIDIVGNYVYIADCGAGFHVIDVSNPTSPVVVGSVDTPGSAKGVFVSGNYAYVGDEAYGLQIIDVSNPTSPVIVANVITSTYVVGVFVSGNYVYVTDAYNGLQIIDISNPTSPTIVGSVDTPNYAIDVVVSDNYAYVADISSGLQIIDISNLTSPTIVGSVDTPNRAYEVILMNNLVLLADRYSGLQIIDVSNPTSPTIVGSVDTPHDAMDLAVFGNYVCIADNQAGLAIISFDCALYLKAGFVSDITSGSVPLTVQFTDQSVGNPTSWFWDFGDGSTSTVQNPSHIYLNDGIYTVSLVVSNASDVDSISSVGCIMAEDVVECIVGLTQTTGYAIDVTVSGNYAYVADTWAGLQIIDISNRQTPTVVGEIDLNTSYDVAVSGNYAYVADYTGDLRVIDISNPSSPVLAASLSLSGVARGLCLSNNYVYLAEGNGMQIIDVSSPTNPQWVSSISSPGYSIEVGVLNEYAYLMDQSSGIQIIDISNSLSPTIVRTVNTPGAAEDIVFVGSLAYVADHDGGLCILDISDPTTASIIGSIGTSGGFEDLAVIGNIVYLADISNDIQIVDVSDPTNPVLVGDIEVDGQTQGVFVEGGYLYIAAMTGGLAVADVECGYLSSNFTAIPRSGYSRLSVQFTDQSVGNPTSWLWDFGDGTTSTEQNPKHTYIGGGNRNVSLTVSDGNITNIKTVENFITVRVKNFKDDPKVELVENYPNPFNPSTTISYSLPTSQRVSLVVYNILGQTVTTLVDGIKEAGEHSAIWDGRNDYGSPVSSGMYFYRLTTAENSIVRKMILLK